MKNTLVMIKQSFLWYIQGNDVGCFLGSSVFRGHIFENALTVNKKRPCFTLEITKTMLVKVTFHSLFKSECFNVYFRAPNKVLSIYWGLGGWGCRRSWCTSAQEISFRNHQIKKATYIFHFFYSQLFSFSYTLEESLPHLQFPLSVLFVSLVHKDVVDRTIPIVEEENIFARSSHEAVRPTLMNICTVRHFTHLQLLTYSFHIIYE